MLSNCAYQNLGAVTSGAAAGSGVWPGGFAESRLGSQSPRNEPSKIVGDVTMWLYRCLSRLYRDDNAAVAVLTAVFLTAFIGIMGATIDLGILYSAHSQLQSAADSAALASASELVTDLNGDGVADSNYSGAESLAHEYVGLNKFLENMLEWTAKDTFEAGVWDFQAKDFSHLGETGDPDDLTAVRITLKRTVKTIFTPIVGITDVELTASTTGYLGYAGNGGKGDIPVAMQKSYLDSIEPGTRKYWQGDENVQWTTYTDSPTNASKLKHLVNHPEDIPRVNINDTMYMTNGMVDSALKELHDKYDENKNGADEWHVVMPVVDWSNEGSDQKDGPLVGFVHFVITEVKSKGNPKYIDGYWADGGAIVAEGAGPGGGNWGVRSSLAALVD